MKKLLKSVIQLTSQLLRVEKKKKKKKKKEKRRLQNANAIVGSRFEVQAQVIWCIGPMSPIQ